MDYEIKNGKLIITVDAEEQAEFAGVKNGMDDYEALEPLVCNSDLDWLRPEDTGDLTDAPMLALVARNADDGEIVGVLDRWAFMDYQVTSIADRLARDGKVVFIS